MNSGEDKQFRHLKAELLGICEQIQKIEQIASIKNFKQKLNLVDHMAHKEVTPWVKQIIRADPELQPCLRNILQIHRQLGVLVELEIGKEILASPTPWKTVNNFYYFRNYQFLVKLEGTTANLLPGDKVTFWGSGPFPLTLILLHRLFQIRGIGIEIEPDRADFSRRVLEKLCLDEEIKIFTGSEDSLILAKDSKLVMVAAFVEPRKRIFQRLAEVVDPDTMVSYRIYEKGMRDIFSSRPLDKSELAEFLEIKRIPPQGPVNNTIVFLKKRPYIGKPS